MREQQKGRYEPTKDCLRKGEPSRVTQKLLFVLEAVMLQESEVKTMNIECLKIKCPVCGRPNAPVSVTLDQGWTTRVRADYECRNVRKRIFRRDRPCETRYKIEWNGAEAQQMIERTKEGKAK